MEKSYERIQTYLDNIFASLPQSADVLQKKNDMYCSMLDKFNGLVQGGTNEDEAFGKVVAEFSSLDEVRSALGINANAAGADSVSVTAERNAQYKKFKIRQGILIAIGVVICMAALFLYPLYQKFLIEEGAEALFGLLVGLGVFLFVFAGVSESKFFDVKKPVTYAVPPTLERLAEYQKFLTARAWLISFAVFLFIVSVFIVPILEVWLGNLCLLSLMLVAVGVAILIIIGTIHSTYKDVSGQK